MEWDIEITVPAPKIGKGKKKTQYATANNLPYFYRYGVTRIKTEFKNNVKKWYIQKSLEPPSKSAEIHYTILRNTNRKMDSDAFAATACKWLQDLLVELKYIKDDDNCKVILNPTKLGVEGVETSILMQVKLIKD